MNGTAALDRLAALVGIEPDYADGFGSRRAVETETKRRLLTALGYTVEDDKAVEHIAAALWAEHERRVLPPVLVRRQSELPDRLMFMLAPRRSSRGLSTWNLELESGETRGGRLQSRAGEVAIDLPVDLPLGYHRLTVQGAGSCHLIVAPQRAWRPTALDGEGRLWGLNAQLYSLRSPRNWGIGDFSDLKRMVRGAAELGASVVGINPLHALFPERPGHISPYSASSRLFRNPIYLDIEAIADCRDNATVGRLFRSPHMRQRLEVLREAATVDYPGVSELKLDVLARLHRTFRERRAGRPEDPRVVDFRAFVDSGGEALHAFCTFHALAEHFQAAGRIDWRAWPAEYRDPASPTVAHFAAEHEERVDFHAYLQWLTDRQLGDCADVARRLGLPVGLYGDLAIGADPTGAEAWANQNGLAIGVQAGAPPDAMNRLGQNWGFPPFDLRHLMASGYRPFIELLRTNMRHVGALRIDHVIGLMRLYCIPEGAAATEGAFMRYPWRDLLAIVALESVRNRCLVIGEDLGTVPDGLREALAEHGILTYKLLFFEKEVADRFRPPERYEREAVVQIGTHDLPTFAGYWQGADLRLRDRLKLWSSAAQRRAEWRGRVRDRRSLRAAFAAPARPPPQRQAHDFLARTPSRLLLVQVEDLLGLIEQTNLPGTVHEHPNWCRRLPVDLDALLAGSALRELARALLPTRGASPWPGWVPAIAGAAAAPPAIPVATYRVQFSAGTRFDDAARLVPYLARLGISHLYASPWLEARAGSTHGYDITDHNAINPEIGDHDALEHLSHRLAAHGIGHILDFVPNHMGIGKADNAWWLDVLEWGEQSPFADHFDVDWVGDQRRLRGKVLLPMLGDPYGQVLEAGGLVPRFDASTGSYSVWYYEHRFPIRPRDYAGLIAAAADAHDDATARRLRRFVNAFGDQAGRRARARTLQRRLATVALNDLEASRRLAQAAAALAGRPSRPRSFAALHRLLERQHFRLSHWRAAAHEINYRRFFDINELAGIRVEQPAVFEAVHRLIRRLLATDRLHGLRIDHIDGLYDPKQYLQWLQHLRPPGGSGLYVVVEKILARHERLREDWTCAGSTGYEVLNQITGVLIDTAGERPLTRAYHRFLGRDADFDAVLLDAKDLVTGSLLASELQVLARDLLRLSEQHWRTRDYTLEGLRQALAAVVIRFPVYRTYVDGEGADADDRRDIAWAVSQARRNWAGPGAEILDFIADVLTTDIAVGDRPDYPRDQVTRLAMRFQQYTGPVMAKSMEDTAFYRYHRLLALNEVGGDPRQFGLSPAAWHHAAGERARHRPHGMVATATHDTKRGEDARARLAVLSELADPWSRRVRRWRTLNRSKRSEVDEAAAPGRNDEYLLYQSLLGAWPPGLGGGTDDASGLHAFAERIKAYMTKALREGKVSSTWTEPNADYEAAMHRFVDGILDPVSARLFLGDFLPFQARVARLGVLNSLSQVALKLMSPGVPDIYQGTELWDFSLVDPDNRRPVDFARRAALLEHCDALRSKPPAQRCPALSALLEDWHDGAIKLFVTLCLLRLRDTHRALFRDGDYAAVECRGNAEPHVLAFLRQHEGERVLVAVARHMAGLADEQGRLPDPVAWGESNLTAPAGWPHAIDALTGRRIAVSGTTISVAQLFGCLPVAVLLPEEPT